MRPLFDITQPIDRSKDYAFECEGCHKTFLVKGVWLNLNIRAGKNKHKFCGKKCQTIAQVRACLVKCAQCGKEVSKQPAEQRQSRSGRSFCSRSCAAKYNNAHKTSGTRRSKLEVWLQDQLIVLFPQLEVKYNDVKTINAELDIYAPSLNLAFELNGIFHYEPIHGTEKLANIQNNDNRRFQACLERGIELVIIDTSKEKYFKPERGKKYLDIIQSLIELKLESLVGLEPT